MRIELFRGGMMVVPETDFERQYLMRFNDQETVKVFLKSALSGSDFVGLKIVYEEKMSKRQKK